MACRWLDIDRVLSFLLFFWFLPSIAHTFLCSVVAETRIDFNTYDDGIKLDIEKMSCYLSARYEWQKRM
jgi:hypothetical protein